ncbi:MAG: GGDEF domain-containing protein [Lachnospiraceae bacterium]|nr:GGDEF domain-containing protein [Lachnospiraceae bacterium]
MSCKSKSLTIGVLVSGILDEFTRHICNGIMAEASEQNVNVLIFPGKYLDRDLSTNRELMYEYQYSTVFSYIRQGAVDALIIAADCIGCFATPDRIRQLLESFAGIPSVLIASKMDGYIDVSFDNEAGIREGLEYLIRTCGCRKIGMIGGHDNNSDAVERHTIFSRVLAENGLDCPKQRYMEGELTKNNQEVYREFLDANPDLDAIFCVNDDIALGLYKELEHRSIRPGRDISILGFDDSSAGAKASPPLSSVLADPTRLGAASVCAVLELYHHRPIWDASIPTRFVLRDSIMQTNNGRKSCEQILNTLEDSFHDIFYHYYHEEKQLRLEEVRLSYIRMFDYLAAYFMRKGDNSVSSADIGAAADQFLKPDIIGAADIDGLMTVFEQFYHALLDLQKDDTCRFELRNAFSMLYRRMIRAMNQHSATVIENENQNNYDMKLFVQNILQFEQGTDESSRSLLHNLGWLGIKNAWLYLLPVPVVHPASDPFETPGMLELKAELLGGAVQENPPAHPSQTLEEVFRYTKPACGDEHAQVLLPLFFGKIVYGILICDMTPALYVNGEFLVNQLSSAIKMISLLQANEKIQAKLEGSLETLKDHNIELDAMSKSDPLTGILNMRGFYMQAEERLNTVRTSGRPLVALYIDMDNLKIVNDRFGHKEGDSSLRQIARILKDFTDGRGIAGRIGGDEFTCLIEVHDADFLEAPLYTSLAAERAVNDSNALHSVLDDVKQKSGECPVPHLDSAAETPQYKEQKKDPCSAECTKCPRNAESKKNQRSSEPEQELLATLYEKFDHYNQTSEKPYLLTVSAGAYTILPDDDISLKDALIRADQRLYEKKKTRKYGHIMKAAPPQP